ncbi:MAG: dockerin type I repeat-containing protein [Prevotella sp.]|nr:dockerin type I repeat-containing protein [Prevotella sp.]
MGANAEEVVDVEVDYTAYDSDVWNGGYRQVPDATTLEIIPGVGIHVDNPEAPANNWDLQFQLPAIPTASFDSDTEYTVTFKIKASVDGTIEGGFSGSNNQQIAVSTSEQEVVLTGLKDNPTAQYWAKSGAFMIQSGNFVGEYWISYVKITHEQAAGEKPVTWKDNMIVNGDAEKSWEELNLADVTYTETDKTIGICAWGKAKGTNVDDTNTSNPFPADIEEDPTDPSNHVFVVHGAPADTEGDASAWDNQFWIMSPKELKVGTQYYISFRYRATEVANTNTQEHSAQPSDYLMYQCLGDINFTTEWQTFDSPVEIVTPQNDRPIYSIAFNLNAQNKNAIDFYFDDLSIKEMDVEEGCFAVAKSDNSDYNYNAPIEFEEDPREPGVFTGTVGTSDEWVNEVIISTTSGNKKAFLAGAIKPASSLNASNVETWLGYTEVNGYKYQLPAGVWEIVVDTNPAEEGGHLVMFTQIEGETLSEPVDITTNESELAIEGVERNYLNADEAAADGVELPEDYAVGYAWDNQFWIVSDRVLQAGEATVVEFDYYLVSEDITEAKVTTQSHSIERGYIHWAAIGDVNFTPEEQHFKVDFTIPNECADKNMGSIAFNMAEIKPACTYVIKNVKWYMKSEELNGDGQTIENLIAEEGTDNFWVKISAGTDPYQWGKKPADLKGDANGDGIVDVSDIDTIIEAIGGEYVKAADVNGDGVIDVSDIDFVIENIK